MSWSGGTYKKGNFTTNGWTGDASLGIGIEAGRHDTQDDDFAAGINQCLNKDGSNAATGNLNAGAFRVTNLGAGTARTDAAQVGQVQDGTSSYLGTTAGTSTAFTVTATPTITALVTGAQYRFKANAANGVAATLKIDGTTATTMQRQGTALVGNEFKANDFVSVVYDGTNFQITNVATAPLYVDRTNNRVGIGTTTPTYDLEVANTATRCQITRFSNDIAGTQIDLAKSRGATVGTNTIVQSGDILGVLRFAGANGTGFSEAGYIAGWVDGTPGATNDMPGRITFATTSDGAGTATERMRISANGNVGIGNTATGTSRLSLIASGAGATNMIVDCYNSAPSRQFAVREDGNIIIPTVYFIGSGAAANVVIDASGFLYRSTSSLKYKENIQPLPYGLSDVLQLNAVTFSSKNENENGVRFAGLIAEEVDAVGLNEFVQYAPDGSPDALHYGNMVSLAFKAIQELNAKVEALEARIAALEA